MTREYLIHHLINEDCYPDLDCNFEEAQLWRNGINGEVCYVPYSDTLELATYCHIIYELRINPPLEYDADYHVYLSFKEKVYETINDKKQRI